MTFTYFWNGASVSRAQASLLVAREAYSHGYEKENWEPAFRSPGTEERREFLNEISGYQLEIVAH
ncbi:hypothetical protein [Paraburkholderia rhynchosiae]|uniref:Uncharacterized protein n=1 Tax=Paraburkholderia rhynchosiae TaxID=487049 RepID=A0A2N7W987_9BURK|nr:hypothetical protein [Paraburkholderia rhynchosiae]PMS25967.1 hypothetical protein C0Z16_27930 [Paraburkholderia rhynchosiae]CAB3730605.1 hypothetical protein LMG27174_05761 [Paraburkholderia rhynchosiae]